MDNHCNCLIFFHSHQASFQPFASLYFITAPHLYPHSVLSVFSQSLSCSYRRCFSQHRYTSLYISLFLSFPSLPPSLSACSVASGILLFQMRCWLWNWDSLVPPLFSAHIHITISISHHHYHIFFHFLLHPAVHVWLSSECHFGVKSQRCSLC